MRKKVLMLRFIVVSCIILLFGMKGVHAVEYYSPSDVLIVTSSKEMAENHEFIEQCKNKKIDYRLVNSNEQIDELVSLVEKQKINKIIYFNKGNENSEIIKKIVLRINRETTVDKYTIFDLSYVEKIFTKFEIKKQEPIEIAVINRDESVMYPIYKEASYNRGVVGHVYGNLAEVKIKGSEGNYYKVEALSYYDKRIVNGYVPKEDIRIRVLTSPYRVEINLNDQRVYVYKDGIRVREIVCSTGLGSDYTPKGRFIIGYRGPSFGDLNTYTCYNWVRFNHNYLFHSVLYNKNGTVNKYAESRLGKPASHGCIRMPKVDSKWFYDNIPQGTLVEVK